MARTGRPKARLEVTAAERVELERLARRARTNRHVALRARIVLRSTRGESNVAVAAKLRCSNVTVGKWRQRFRPGFPFCLPRMAPLYTRGPPSARNSVHRTIVQLQRPSPQPALTCDRLEPLLSGHSSDTAPHLCPFFVRRASLHSPRVSLPGPVAPRSSAACRRTAAGSDALPPAGASSTSRASPAGLRFSPAAAASSSATSA